MAADRAERESEDGRPEDRRDRGEEPGERPHDRRHARDAHAEQPGPLGVLRCGSSSNAVAREPEEQHKTEQDQRDDKQHDDVVTLEEDAAELEASAERALDA